jgi:hypothetical protein
MHSANDAQRWSDFLRTSLKQNDKLPQISRQLNSTYNVDAEAAAASGAGNQLIAVKVIRSCLTLIKIFRVETKDATVSLLSKPSRLRLLGIELPADLFDLDGRASREGIEARYR